MSDDAFRIKKRLNIQPDGTTLDTEGDVGVNSTSGLQFYHNSATRTAADLNSTQTLTNKTLTSPTISSPSGLTKSDVGLGNVDNTSDSTKNSAAVALTNKTIVVASNTITTASSGNLAATELNAALSELQSDIDTRMTTTAGNALVSDTAYGVGWDAVTGIAPSKNAVYDQMELKAPLASPALTGNPTAPTQTAGNNSTRIATTAYADALVSDTAYEAGWDTVTGIAPSKNAVYDKIAALETTVNTKAASSSPTLTTPTIDIITLDGQGSTPANPSSGYYKAYVADSDGKLKILNSSGIVTTVGSGTSGINYLNVSTDNSTAESNSVGDWVTYADAAATSPVDGTGGSPSSTFTVTSSSPLRGTYSYLITKGAANRQGEGASVNFTIDAADKSKQLAISFDYSASANYSGSSGTEYMTCYVYDVTNSTLIPTSTIEIPYGSGTQQITFMATTSTSYRLIFHIAGTGTSSWTYTLDNVQVGPQTAVISPAQGDWVAWTPTGSLTTNVTYSGYYKRVGDQGYYRVLMAFSGANTEGAVTINMPTGQAIDTTKILKTTNDYVTLGVVTNADVSVTDYVGTVVYNSSTVVSLRSLGGGVGAGSNRINTANVNTSTPTPWGAAIASGDFIVAEWAVPIANWSSNIQLANSRVEYASNSGMSDAADTSSFINDPNGSPLPTVTYTAAREKTVRFKNPIQASDTVVLQVKPNNANSTWIDIPIYFRDAGAGVSIYNDGNTGIAMYGTTSGGVPNSTDVVVTFFRYYSSTNNWSGSNTARWRVVKYPNAVPVESSGHDYLTATSSTKTPTASGNYQLMTGSTVTLTPGLWQLTGLTNYSNSGAASYSAQAQGWYLANGADSGSEPTAITPLSGYYYTNVTTSGANQVPASTILYRVTTSTAIYLVPFASMTTAANARITSYITAVRLA